MKKVYIRGRFTKYPVIGLRGIEKHCHQSGKGASAQYPGDPEQAGENKAKAYYFNNDGKIFKVKMAKDEREKIIKEGEPHIGMIDRLDIEGIFKQGRVCFCKNGRDVIANSKILINMLMAIHKKRMDGHQENSA